MLFSSTVPSHLAGRTLVDYLSTRFTYHSSDDWLRLLGEGRVLLNGRRTESAHAIELGDTVSYEPYPFAEPPADCSFRIAYEDQWLLAVDKPGNLLVHRAGRSFTSNLVYLVRNGMGCAATPQASSINRLDRETSGLVLFAKDERTLSVLGAAFRERNVDKEYVAVVHGRPAAGLSLIDAPIGRDSESAHGSRHRIDVVNGKAAQTAVLCCKAAGDSHSVLRLSPLTGRTHQLRLHCRHAGCPIVGDRWYGVEGGDALFHRPALHCLRLAFEHPSLRTRLTIEAPLPQELCGLVQRLSASAAQPQPSSCPH